MDISASDKTARFIQLRDAFRVPLISLVGIPGFLSGADQEHAGITRYGTKLLYVYLVAGVSRLTVVLYKACGSSYLAMCFRNSGADLVYTWPTVEIVVMGTAGAINVVLRREIQTAEDPKAVHWEKIQSYSEQFAMLHMAVSCGFVGLVTRPSETRARLLKVLELLINKERQPHPRGNIPP